MTCACCDCFPNIVPPAFNNQGQLVSGTGTHYQRAIIPGHTQGGASGSQGTDGYNTDYIRNGSGVFQDLANTTSYPTTNLATRYAWKDNSGSGGVNFNNFTVIGGESYRGGTVADGGLGRLGEDYRWIAETASGNVTGTLSEYTPATCTDTDCSDGSCCVRCRSYNDNGTGSGVGQGCLASGPCDDRRLINRYRYRVIRCNADGDLEDFTSTAVTAGIWPSTCAGVVGTCIGTDYYTSTNSKLDYYAQFCDDCSCDDDLVNNGLYPSYFTTSSPAQSDTTGTMPSFASFAV